MPIKIWDISSDKEIALLEQVRDPFAFSNDGKFFAAVSSDSNSIIKIFHTYSGKLAQILDLGLDTTTIEIGRESFPKYTVSTLVFSLNDKFLAIGLKYRPSYSTFGSKILIYQTLID